jgi:hypothetical protein
VGLITGHCPLNKHLNNMGFIDESIGISFVCSCSSLISLRIRTLKNPILGVDECERMLAYAPLLLVLVSGRLTATP